MTQGETLLGRSPECHVTIEDPLVSRRHARIFIDGTSVLLEDLGSRNGVRLNGNRINDASHLKDRDRIRIGMQEFVFLALPQRHIAISSKSTGSLRTCPQCGHIHLEGVVVCPNCGHDASRQGEENTLTGVFGGNKPDWAAQLLIELLERALVVGCWDEAEHVLRRASVVVEERLEAGEVDPAQFEKLMLGASKLAIARASEQWATWIMNCHATTQTNPSTEVVARLRTVAFQDKESIRNAVDAVLNQSDVLSGTKDDAVEALAQWRRELFSQG